jgi:hypothetical protein
MFADLIISDTVWLAIIGLFAMAMKEYFDRGRAKDAATAAKDAAEKVSEVAATAVVAAKSVKDVASNLEASDKKQDTKLDAIHTLVNSNMGAQLKLTAVYAREVANLKKNSPDADAAESLAVEAEKLLAEHEAKQKVVDAKVEPPGVMPSVEIATPTIVVPKKEGAT